MVRPSPVRCDSGWRDSCEMEIRSVGQSSRCMLGATELRNGQSGGARSRGNSNGWSNGQALARGWMRKPQSQRRYNDQVIYHSQRSSGECVLCARRAKASLTSDGARALYSYFYRYGLQTTASNDLLLRDTAAGTWSTSWRSRACNNARRSSEARCGVISILRLL